MLQYWVIENMSDTMYSNVADYFYPHKIVSLMTPKWCSSSPKMPLKYAM